MRWEGRERSANVEDRRRFGGKGMAVGGLGTLVIAVIAMLMGADPSALLQQGGGGQVQTTPEQDKLVEFVSVVLKDTEDVWHEQFRKMGKTYREPKLKVFTGSTQSGCGHASSAVGPFYCPVDETIYIDLSFFEMLRQRFGAPGDFAQAYVIAHEVGHHVQKQLGSFDHQERARAHGNEVEVNRVSVRTELQADFLAGVWAHHAERTKHVLEEGDVEEALRAASAIGDDTLQKQSQGHVVPDSFTHGSSAQRVAWFRHGLQTGDVAAGNTFDDRVFERVPTR